MKKKYFQARFVKILIIPELLISRVHHLTTN